MRQGRQGAKCSPGIGAGGSQPRQAAPAAFRRTGSRGSLPDCADAAGGAPAVKKPLAIESVRVRPGRIELSVRVANQRYARTTPQLIEYCLRQVPTLGMHACRNDEGPTFAHVMRNTSVPHLFEHLVVDAQTRAANDPTRVFAGTTQWSAEDPLVANITVSFEDDLVALRAVKESLAFLNGALAEVLG